MKMHGWRWATYLAVLWLAGCGSGLSGTWEDQVGIATYEFQRDGYVRISALGSTVMGEYTMNGKKVLLTSPQGTVVLTRKGDRLFGPMGMELIRQPD